MRLILLGMKHSGKSTLGRDIAGRLGCPFYDVDELIEDHIERQEGERLSVREVFRRLGPEGFSEIEKQVVFALYQRLDGQEPKYVLALGGRTPLNRDLGPVLGRMGTAVFLDVDPQRLWDRVSRAGVPPFLDPQHPREDFLEMHQSRVGAYRRVADITVPLDAEADPEQNARKVMEAVERHASGGK